MPADDIKFTDERFAVWYGDQQYQLICSQGERSWRAHLSVDGGYLTLNVVSPPPTTHNRGPIASLRLPHAPKDTADMRKFIEQFIRFYLLPWGRP